MTVSLLTFVCDVPGKYKITQSDALSTMVGRCILHSLRFCTGRRSETSFFTAQFQSTRIFIAHFQNYPVSDITLTYLMVVMTEDSGDYSDTRCTWHVLIPQQDTTLIRYLRNKGHSDITGPYNSNIMHNMLLQPYTTMVAFVTACFTVLSLTGIGPVVSWRQDCSVYRVLYSL